MIDYYSKLFNKKKKEKKENSKDNEEDYDAADDLCLPNFSQK